MSSIRISRSSAGISRISALRKVVLPVEVPPETRMFLRAAHRGGEHAGDVAGVELRRQRPVDLRALQRIARRASRRRRRPRHNRRARGRARHACGSRAPAAPRVAGGATTWTRAPSGRVAESRGCSRLIPWCDERRDLPGEARQRRFVERRRVVPLDLAADRLDPELAGPVDVDVGDVGPRQHAGQRREIGAEIDALPDRRRRALTAGSRRR